MKKEHKAIIQAAKRDGLLPSEVASNLLGHDLLESMIAQLSKLEAYRRMSEKDQDGIIAAMTNDIQPAIKNAMRILNAAGVESVPFTLKGMKIDNKLTVTGTVDGDDPSRHILTDKCHGKSEILLVLYPRDYFDAMDQIEGEKDQKSLALDEGEKPAKKPRAKKQVEEPKPIEIPKKFLDDARDFVTIQQNCTVAGLQNQMRCGYEKAVATLDLLRAEGIVTRTGEAPNDQFELVRDMVAPAASTKDAEGLPATYGDLTYSEVQQTVVLHAKAFYLPWLSDRFKIEGEQAEHLALRLLDDGVIEAEQSDVVEGEPPLVTYKVIATLADLDLPF
jgi:S-DNA-T family DNA segregation ATPase FtsK/SpoIIIE